MNASPEAPTGKTCLFYISIIQPECGEQAVAEVGVSSSVPTRANGVKIWLCPRHVAEANRVSAQIRRARKAG